MRDGQGEHAARPRQRLEAWLELRLTRAGARFVLGDLREEYAARARRSSRLRADAWYLGEALRLALDPASRRLRRRLPEESGRGLAERIGSIGRDVRYGLRSLRRTPLLTGMALATLALGIGANTAIFSLVEAVLLRPLPYPESERLVRVYAAYPERDIERGTLSEPDLRDWRTMSESLGQLSGFPSLDVGGLVLTAADRPVQIRAHYVLEGFFETLGTAPLLGRTFAASDQEDGANRVVVLSHAAWQVRFGGDPGIVGSTLILSDTPFQVVGVMPPAFDYPSPEGALWLPLSVIPESGIPRRRAVRFLSAVGRLAPGVTLEQAEAELTTIARRLAAEHPDSNAQLTAATVVPLREQMTGGVRSALLALLGAVGVVLLIGCVNVANLMLVRARRRSRELAVRAALGAGRWRLARQMLGESVLLGGIGGALGLALAAATVRSLVAMAPAEIPRLTGVGVNAAVVLFALGASLLTGMLFGLAPAWSAWRDDLRGGLRPAAGPGETSGAGRGGGVLVMAQVALVAVLLVGAGLLLRSLGELLHVDPGFERQGAVALSVGAPLYKLGPDPDIAGFYGRVLDRVRALPGVVAAGVVRPLPLGPDTFQGEDFRFTVPGDPPPAEGQEPEAALRFVSAGLFRAMGIPLLAGRDFDPAADIARPPARGVINASLARRHFAGNDPVGRRLAVGGGEVEIIGVVGDVRQTGLDEEVRNVVYVPITQSSRAGMSLVVRTDGEPTALLGAIQEAIWEVNPDQPIENIATLDALVDRSVAEQRYTSFLVGLFAAVALALAAVGIYGVVAQTVSGRAREIGIRMALGARGADVLRVVVARGMAWVGAGIVIGMAAAWLVSRTLESLLHGIPPTDLPTYLGAVGVLVLVALVATLAPARRAVRVDPARSLRTD